MTVENKENDINYLDALGITQWCLRVISPDVIWIIGEEEETEQNTLEYKPLLDAMLASMGLSRESVKKVFLFQKDVEKTIECLNEQITSVPPKILVVSGQLAAHHLLQKNLPLIRLRGHRWTFGTQQIPLIVTFHPSYLLRSPLYKAEAYADLLQIQQCLSQLMSKC